ncbi:class I SAM-dependent methyltransferase [Campylobacter coli]|nr:class I SAM-dependent methyltransferase [Campylobacter coli]EAK4846763.1 class I SAM-dependent methyltransferase [Campylobacter coli]EAL3865309.1 class I SAM-dependent methyltransferase [Campylobacter coli]HEB9320472.1 class I SAM-dependent methyltransferase [Campylobacter coli]
MSSKQEYWENYLSYWLKRVKDSNVENNGEAKDKIANDEVSGIYIDLLNSYCKKRFLKNIILDYGCGSGRFYEKICSLGMEYYGCDIAQSCLEYCKKKYSDIRLKQVTNDKIPWDSNFFNSLFCYGVFDACEQNILLGEILRVLKSNGVALITGKNILFHEDDSDALHAEVAARKNGHPNYFTDFRNMYSQLIERKIHILEMRFFERRQDISINKFTYNMPDKFYSWILYISKPDIYTYAPFSNFSSNFSTTFLSSLKNEK